MDPLTAGILVGGPILGGLMGSIFGPKPKTPKAPNPMQQVPFQMMMAPQKAPTAPPSVQPSGGGMGGGGGLDSNMQAILNRLLGV